MHSLQGQLGGVVETVVLDDGYHVVTLGRQRQLVVSRTLDFIAPLPARAADRTSS